MENTAKYLIGFAAAVMAVLALSVAPAAGQSEANRAIVGGLENVEAGSECTASALNNFSVHGNTLEIVTGSDGNTIYGPIERVEGENVVRNFIATGGNITVAILYDGTYSIDFIPVTCEAPQEQPCSYGDSHGPAETDPCAPAPTTTVPVEECPIADAIAAGWTPGGDIPCGHGPQDDPQPTTTTTTEPEPTTTTTEQPAVTTTTVQDSTPSTTVPQLAITGPGRTGSLLIVAGLLLIAGYAIVRVANEENE